MCEAIKWFIKLLFTCKITLIMVTMEYGRRHTNTSYKLKKCFEETFNLATQHLVLLSIPLPSQSKGTEDVLSNVHS
jgi:hypothetical protein